MSDGTQVKARKESEKSECCRLICISGYPGSGKTTQLELVRRKYHFPVLVLGNLLKELEKEDDEVRLHRQSGKIRSLPPRKLSRIIDTWTKTTKLSGHDCALFYRGPWNVEICQEIHNIGVCVDLFLQISLKPERILERVTHRRIDPVTNRIYNLKFDKPETKEIASRLRQKFGDSPSVFKKRITRYEKQSEPIISYYRKRGVFRVVDGEGSQKEVFQSVCSMIDKLPCSSK